MLTKSIVDEILNGKSVRTAITEAGVYKIPADQIPMLDVEAINPDDKDKRRADNMNVASDASRMAKLITDPYKLVRRSKAVVARWGADRRYGFWRYFKARLEDMGFTDEQIEKIESYA